MSERKWRAIGVISGTSMDAIDVALIETDGLTQVRGLGARGYAYDPALRADLGAVVADRTRAATDPLGAIEARVTEAHAGAVAQFMAEEAVRAGMPPHSVHFFERPQDAGEFVRLLVQPGDAILFKGSRGVQIERTMEKVLA